MERDADDLTPLLSGMVWLFLLFPLATVILTLVILVLALTRPLAQADQAQLYRDAAAAVKADLGLEPDWRLLLAADAVILRQQWPLATADGARRLARLAIEERRETETRTRERPCQDGETPPCTETYQETVIRRRLREPDEFFQAAGLEGETLELARRYHQWLLAGGDREILDLAPCVPPGWRPVERDWAWPVPGHFQITSCFGPRLDPLDGTPGNHSGLDVAAPDGAPVVAARDGTVSQAGPNGNYGLSVTLDHALLGTEQTLYAHLSSLAVRPGQQVRRGDVIGYVGSTGKSTGPHLHLEYRRWWRPVDPLPLWR